MQKTHIGVKFKTVLSIWHLLYGKNKLNNFQEFCSEVIQIQTNKSTHKTFHSL